MPTFANACPDPTLFKKCFARNKGNSSAAFLHILQCLAMHPMSAVNAALELHGAAVLPSSPLQVGSSQKNPGDHAKESKDQCVKGQDVCERARWGRRWRRRCPGGRASETEKRKNQDLDAIDAIARLLWLLGDQKDPRHF